MFEANGIEVSFDAIKELFDMVDKNRTGKLDITKFKSLANNSKAKHMFNKLIKEIRKERHRQHGGFMQIQQLPFTFNIMLEYIINREKRKHLIEGITDLDNCDKMTEDEYMGQIRNLFFQSIEQQQRDLSGMEKIRLRLKMTEIKKQNLSPKQTDKQL